MNLILPCALLGAVLACVHRGLISVPLFLSSLAFSLFVGFCVWYSRPRIVKPQPERPFTSEELKQLGIHLPDPERYDCETFVR